MPSAFTLSLLLLSLTALAPPTPAQTSTDTTTPQRFFAAHGRRALINGYASSGLDIWAYPFEILNDYQVSFRPQGTTTPIAAATLLRRVTYNSDSITRTYLGPNFIVHETLFVPLDQPAAIVSYSVESAQPVAICIHATPILNLMWPASVGGQSTAWNPSLNAFLLSEQTDGYTALIGSPNLTAHDQLGNRTSQVPNGYPLGFTLQPSSSGPSDPAEASLFIALNLPGTKDISSLFESLQTNYPSLRQKSTQHLADLASTLVTVTTPDPQINQALAASELALDQAWVCNPDLGCGFIAGYGPSRGARRPQYDWFFAGDGLIAASAAATAGNFAQARAELAFILRYQDKQSGMIWHELSQSAALIDWAGKYPYMYVHVDITFQFLTTLAHYIALTGDTQFLRDHWPAIAAAYHYCESVIDPATNLPRIPSNKEGGDEQDRLSDDFGLSLSWLQATAAFQQLATLTGHSADTAVAATANRLARSSIPNRYWDAPSSFFLSGHAESGRPVPERRSSPSEAVLLNLFTPQQNDHLLNELASASFQTDWGTSGVAANSSGYDPTSYAKGSVSALGTADLATTFWSAHRSTQAFALWSALLPWFSLDSPGHLHEVLAANVFQSQEESVPEQTWSSAGFVTATIQGLLGLQPDPLAHRLTFAPHLPSTWHDLTLAHIPLADAKLTFTLHQTSDQLNLTIDNPGPTFTLTFAPTLPLGAIIAHAELNNHPVRPTTQQDLPDTVANLILDIPHGPSQLHLLLHGGLSVLLPTSTPLLGDLSHNLHLIDLHLSNDTLTLTADIPADRTSTLDIATDWTLLFATNATAETPAPHLLRLTLHPQTNTPITNHYQRVEATLHLHR